MAWSGGTFTRVGGATHWVDDRNAAIPILATRHDTNDEDLATGVNACLTRDNQAKPTASFLPNSDNSLDLGSLATRWRNVFAVTIQAGDGAVGTPSLTFGSDTDTGIYRVGANNLGFTTGGTFAGLFNGAQQLALIDGTAAAPTHSFSNDLDNGMFRVGADDVGFSAGGVLRVDISTTALTSTLPFRGPTGSVGTPTLSFSGDPDTGFYNVGSANAVDLALGGTVGMQWRTTGTFFVDGSSAVPAVSFINDSDTGFYRDTNNQIGIALNGSTAGQIAQGTFTGTLTGYASGPTGTVNYQRVGKFVTLWITTSMIGTSNASTLTMTGLPSVVQTANGVTVASAAMRSDASAGAGAQVIGTAQVSGSTVTFSIGSTGGGKLLASASSWDASGTKGLDSTWSITYPLA